MNSSDLISSQNLPLPFKSEVLNLYNLKWYVDITEWINHSVMQEIHMPQLKKEVEENMLMRTISFFSLNKSRALWKATATLWCLRMQLNSFLVVKFFKPLLLSLPLMRPPVTFQDHFLNAMMTRVRKLLCDLLNCLLWVYLRDILGFNVLAWKKVQK